MADSRKRRNDRPFEIQSRSKKKFDFGSVQGHRFLIPSKAGGCMIGKGGEVIKRLRAEFNCRIIVPDSQGPERMMIVDASIDVIIDIWNEVFPLIKDSVNAKENDYKKSSTKPIDTDNEVDIRLIIHESQAGCIIGKGGERIRNLIDTHKMSIIKLYPTLCPNSTDRVVRLVATQENVMGCLKSILTLLENQAVKGSRTDYDPDNYDESIAPNYGGYISKDSRFLLSKSSVGGGHSSDNYTPRSNKYEHSHVESNSRSLLYSGSNSRSVPYAVNDLLSTILRITSQDDSSKIVARVSLPVYLVGAVIGIDGHRLSDIKRDSGAHIQLDDERLNDREELFLIRGTTDQIYKAQCLMQLCVRKYGNVDFY